MTQDTNMGAAGFVPSASRIDRLRGVFSTKRLQVVGSGTTKRKIPQSMYYYVEEEFDGAIVLQPLNANMVPSGPLVRISRETLLSDFLPEPSMYVRTVYPRMRELDQTIARGDKFRADGYAHSAEYEYKVALKVDDENIRATFGLGLTYLDRSDKDKAASVFHKLVSLDGAFEPKHKHLFNEFGISLRKNGMYAEALKFYARALPFARDDDHLYYNMARTFYEKGSYRTCARLLRKALLINPDMLEAREFLTFLASRKHGAGATGNGA